VYIDYRKLNKATYKDHFSPSFIDRMLERLAKNSYFCYLDEYSGVFQIPIHASDQDKATFTSLYGTFSYRGMPFGLCNAAVAFQHCVTTIFFDFIKDIMEFFMDDSSVYGTTLNHATTGTLDEAQMNHATTGKEFLVVVLALEKFQSYLINSKVIIFIVMVR